MYLDPANPPCELMLAWNAGSWDWEHRAYWGENLINKGTDGTNSRRYMGPLTATGEWVRLEIPASAVGLDGGLRILEIGGRQGLFGNDELALEGLADQILLGVSRRAE